MFTILLHSATNGQLLGCLGGSVKIPLLDGTTPTIEELYERYKHDPRNNGKDIINYLYSYDFNTNLFTVGELIRVFFTGIKDIYEITLDNGKTIKCTADHPFLTKSKHWKTIRNGLDIGDSLLSFRRENNDGYEVLVHENKGKLSKQYTHRMVLEYKDGINQFDKTYSGHHKDFNPFNNHPQNLCGLTDSQHKSYHSKLRWHDPKYASVKQSFQDHRGELWDAEGARNASNKRWSKFKTKEDRIAHLKALGAGMFTSEWNSTQHPRLVKIPLDEFINYAKTCYAKWQIYEHFKISDTGLLGYCKRNNIDLNSIMKPMHYNIETNGRYTHVSDTLLNRLNIYYVEHQSIDLEQALTVGESNRERNLIKRWDKDNMLEELVSSYNHKIVSIKHIGKAPTYDLTVRGHHNFALDCGIVSKNSTGTGKSTVSTYSICYELYKLMCLKNPNRFYLNADETIWILFFNLNLKLAERTMWGKFQKALQKSPWFMERGTVTGRTNLIYQPNKDIKLRYRFY